ncbi:hypothetical protein CCHR01_13862 [Colletotrichum chrysophilum]|uniref:Uncharacterized protein n=1 Tax=Colletotrichum chrysophilum TaxID=1836956 RepID=A0AAD9A8Q5_9PEZI|nr:hypothetical protein CCHR01_13862 [Colletotrichum chrysophilum]
MPRLIEREQSVSYIKLVDNAKINTFILHLRKGSGRRFLITLAPDGTELLGQGVLSNINYPGVKKDIGLEIECYNAAGSVRQIHASPVAYTIV